MLSQLRHKTFRNFILLARWLRAATVPILTRPHATALAQAAAFNQAFSDSGHWDFALLAGFQTLLRTYVVFTASPVSEFLIAEKASLRFAGSWPRLALAWFALGGAKLPGLATIAVTLGRGAEAVLYVLALALLGSFWA